MTSVLTDQRVDSNAGPKVTLMDNAGGSNAKLWDIIATGNTLVIRTRTDGDGAGVDVLTITRSGTSGTIIALAAALVPSAADDAAAAALNPVVPIGGLYRTASAVKIRVA